jgi:formylglycine-generating enzyme required for sulfatase activity
MTFDLGTWKQTSKQTIKDLRSRLVHFKQHDTPYLLYGFLGRMALWPLVVATKEGDMLAVMMALGSVAGGVGGNLIANQIQAWKDQADEVNPGTLAQWVMDNIPANAELRQALDNIILNLDVLPLVKAELSYMDWYWFRETLSRELELLGNVYKYAASLSGSGTIAQGNIARAAYASGESVAIAGDVHGDVTYRASRDIHSPGSDPINLRIAYLKSVFMRCGYLSLTGIDPKTIGAAEAQLSLSAIYTALLTLNPEQHGRLIIGEHLDQDKRRLSALAQLNQHSRLVLLGDPGSGKSSFVNFVALCLAGAQLEHEQINLELLTAPLPNNEDEADTEHQPWQHGELLPIRIVLWDFASQGLPPIGDRPTAKHLWDFIVADLDAISLAEFSDELKEILHKQGGLLLLDGLDEVPETDHRRTQIKEAVMDFAATFPICRILVTSRLYAYQRQEWQLPGFAEAFLAPFNRSQIRSFIDRWYAHIADLQEMTTEDAQGKANLLRQAIFGSHRLHDLAQRPLLLTLMASLHTWRGGSLPEKREELYADAVDLLLDSWEGQFLVRDAYGQITLMQPSLAEWLKVDRQKVRILLNELAYQAHASQPNLVGTADITERDLVQGLIGLSNDPDLKHVRLVEYLSHQVGLLLPRGVGVYTFPHRTFQEYLAACYLTDVDYPDQLANLTRQDPNRWREVVLLAGAKAARGTMFGLWGLVDALCSPKIEETKITASDLLCSLIAAQAIVETADLTKLSERNHHLVDRIIGWLKRALTTEILPVSERLNAGQLLARLGDDRPGVGLRADELPHIVWCEVPAGSFVMGSDRKQDGQAEDNEQPQHKVTLPDFRISKFPITNSQYIAFINAGGYEQEKYWLESERFGYWEKGKFLDYDIFHDDGPPHYWDYHPVGQVSWYEAIAFCRWLTERLREAELIDKDEVVRLPREAEWEKAARGTDGRIYPWGDEADFNRANYDDTGVGTTTPVGTFSGSSSPYGCEEMSGNVWEWCLTKWQKNYADYRDDDDLEEDAPRVVRGGAFNSGSKIVRCAYRDEAPPHLRSVNLGFRVVVSSE